MFKEDFYCMYWRFEKNESKFLKQKVKVEEM